MGRFDMNASRGIAGSYAAVMLAILLASVSAAPLYAAADPQSILQPSLEPPAAAAMEQPTIVTTGDASDAANYSDGTRAIQENRWADAESIFAAIGEHHGEHAEGALYWKAFAENKLGKSDAALKACAELRQSYSKSRWIDDCGALEIEIRGRNGQPVDPQSEHDENLKLLALNALMHHNESKALPLIEQILAGDQPEAFKENTLFVLAQSQSKQAQKMLANVAQPTSESPVAIQANTALQKRAQQLLAAAQPRPAQEPKVRRLGVDVVVTNTQGKPVAGLEAQDFTAFDNGQPQKIVSFHAFGESNPTPGEPTEVMILIDTVNSSLVDVAYAREQLAIFLRQDGGMLAQPTSLLYFNGNGAQRIGPVSRDGNLLAEALDKAASNLHPIQRSEAFYGDLERLQFSLETLGRLAVDNVNKPGRKLLLWISPGWPLLPHTDALNDRRQVQAYFGEIITLSAALRQARITLDNIDPARNTGADSTRWDYYKIYLKGVSDVNKAAAGNLALQVLAEQSGGRIMTFSNEYLSGEIANCVAGAGTYYFLSFEALPAKRVDEYHSLKITVDKPGLTVHTRSGYYDQP
jgi:VWFA-related protein